MRKLFISLVIVLSLLGVSLGVGARPAAATCCTHYYYIHPFQTYQFAGIPGTWSDNITWGNAAWSSYAQIGVQHDNCCWYQAWYHGYSLSPGWWLGVDTGLAIYYDGGSNVIVACSDTVYYC